MTSRHHHMRQKGELWLFQIGIPVDLRPLYNNRRMLERSLGTKDPAEARLKRDAFLVQYRAEFKSKRKTAATAESEEVSREHAAMLEAFAALSRDPLKAAAESHPLEYALSLPNGTRADMQAHAIYGSGQQPAPLPRGEAVDHYLDDFLKAKDFSAQHADKTRRAVAKLMAWMTATGTQPTIGNLTREVAGDFMESVPGSRKTRVNVSGLLSSYFRYLVNPRGKLDANPFEGLASGLEISKHAAIEKRPYTDEELSALLSEGDSAMLDTIRVLALSGMRASELCSLTVADCRGGLFRVHGGPDDKEGRRGKSAAAKRVIPIHSDLVTIVEARCEKRGKGDLLFPEWNGSAHKLGKAFNVHRMERGVDEKRRGNLQSAVDLHSLRRFFISSAHAALKAGATGFDFWVVVDCAGHSSKGKPGSMSKKYSGKSSVDELRACVESVYKRFYEHVIAYRKHLEAIAKVKDDSDG